MCALLTYFYVLSPDVVGRVQRLDLSEGECTNSIAFKNVESCALVPVSTFHNLRILI